MGTVADNLIYVCQRHTGSVGSIYLFGADMEAVLEAYLYMCVTDRQAVLEPYTSV